MPVIDTSRGRIRAILGPTNTGKTHLAMERMQAYSSGMIGFPLRLLARENYDKLVAQRGASSVALITGEEKIIPANPRWYICTVESMPISEQVDFVAVDEIQLCEDQDRGHVFTDRLLHTRGRYETMFLGSDSMAGLIKRLIDDVEIESRPRLSQLTYAGRAKLTKLPRRSAIVAFSVNDVYALAENIRQHRGGTAVVLGALSPRTRNAQVEMYQAGEVDYLVATDAIGMGLNMDVDHVAFASMRKYDGHHMRGLRPWEIGQIAGRAGRHMNDGTFGVTNNLPDIDEEIVDLVEGHEFAPITHIQWRNRHLNFKNPTQLLQSLQKRSSMAELIRTRDAVDHLSLKLLMKEEDIIRRATQPDRVQLLWDVCQIPDFRKITLDHHAEFLNSIYTNLCDKGTISEDILDKRLKRFESVQGDIDQLTQRLAYVRTWSYVAHRPGWVSHSFEWQERTRQLEDKLSDALHQSLIQRFVDKRAALIGKRGKGDGKLLSAVSDAGIISLEGHVIGRMKGFRFQPDRARDQQEARQLAASAANSIQHFVREAAEKLAKAKEEDLFLQPNGYIAWRIDRMTKVSDKTKQIEDILEEEIIEIAKLGTGPTALSPDIKLLSHNIVDAAIQNKVLSVLHSWLKGYLKTQLRWLDSRGLLDAMIEKANKPSKSQKHHANKKKLLPQTNFKPSANMRGLLFQLEENLGSLSLRHAYGEIEALSPQERRLLTQNGLRFGTDWLYWKPLQNAEKILLRYMLYAIFDGKPADILPTQTPKILPADYANIQSWDKFGYVALYAKKGEHVHHWALRIDHYETVKAALRQLNKKGQGRIVKTKDLVKTLACRETDLISVMRALNFVFVEEEGQIYFYHKNAQKKRKYNKPFSTQKNLRISETSKQKKQQAKHSAIKKQKPSQKDNKAKINKDSPFAQLKHLMQEHKKDGK